jgi:hypothetical protein
MFASLTMYLLWFFMTAVALSVVIAGGADKGVRRGRRSTSEAGRAVPKR